LFKEYFVSSLSVIAIAAAASVLSHSKMRKISRCALGLIMICVIMLPLVDIFKDNDFFFDLDYSFDDFQDDDMNDDEIERAFEIGIEKYIAERYDADVSLIHVSVDGFDISKMKAERIYVTLSGRAMNIDYRRLEDILRENFTDGGECEVELDVG